MSDEIYRLMKSNLIKNASNDVLPGEIKTQSVTFSEGYFDILVGMKTYTIGNYTGQIDFDKLLADPDAPLKDTIVINKDMISKIEDLIKRGYKKVDLYLNKIYGKQQEDELKEFDRNMKINKVRQELLIKPLNIVVHSPERLVPSSHSSNFEERIYMSTDEIYNAEKQIIETIYHEVLHALNSKIYLYDDVEYKGFSEIDLLVEKSNNNYSPSYAKNQMNIQLLPPLDMIGFFKFYVENITGYKLSHLDDVSAYNFDNIITAFSNVKPGVDFKYENPLVRAVYEYVADLAIDYAGDYYKSTHKDFYRTISSLVLLDAKEDTGFFLNKPEAKAIAEKILKDIAERKMTYADFRRYYVQNISEKIDISKKSVNSILLNPNAAIDIYNAIKTLNSASNKYYAGSSLITYVLYEENIEHMRDEPHVDLINSVLKNLISFLQRGIENPGIEDTHNTLKAFLNLKYPKALYLKPDNMRIVAGLYDYREVNSSEFNKIVRNIHVSLYGIDSLPEEYRWGYNYVRWNIQINETKSFKYKKDCNSYRSNIRYR